MQHKANNKTGYTKRLILGILCVSVFSMGMFTAPQPANAQNAVVGAVGGIVACYIGGLLAELIPTQVPVNDSTDNTKDCMLDGIAKGLANAVLQDLTYEIVNWILTGFEGKPMFVTDLKSYLLGIADEVAGEYIYGSELSFLCSPFELDIRIALAYQYLGDPNPVACTLTEALGNVDAFFAGDFSEGGFPRWLEVFAHPTNNPYGAAQVAEATLQARLADEEFNTRQILDFGNGFLSYEKCETPEEGDHPGRETSTEEYCYMTTPGHVIAEQLTFQLETGSLQLIEADEINESISAIVSALAFKVLQNGLANLNDDGYLDDFKDEPVPQESIDGPGVAAPGGGGTVHGGSNATMLWKPISESDGRLVVLTPTSFGTPNVRVLTRSCDTIETGDYVGHTNGNRATYRFGQWGGAYPSDAILAVDGNLYTMTNGVGQRNEGGALQPTSCGGGGTTASSGGSGSGGGGSNDSGGPTNPNPTVSGPGGGEPHPNPAPGIL